MNETKHSKIAAGSAKERADRLLVAAGLAESREKAQALILSGSVWSGDMPIAKAGQLLAKDAELSVRGAHMPYVSRGGLKLEKALQQFAIDPSARICMDIGASTGGFTDCLLQNGAAKVYSIDVGYGQLAWSLRQDSRVINLERQNFRHLDRALVPQEIEIAVSDVSFISLRHIFVRLPEFLQRDARVIALIKPQFEAGRKYVGKQGVVRDKTIHTAVLAQVQRDAYRAGLQLLAVDWSPVKGPKGNIEFVSLWRLLDEGEAPGDLDFQRVVEEAHINLTGGAVIEKPKNTDDSPVD